MIIPDWLQRRLACMLPSIFLAPDERLLDIPIVHHDHPVRHNGVTWFTRGDRTDAEFRAFIKATMMREGDAPPQVGATARHGGDS